MKYAGETFDPILDEERLNDQTIRVYRLMIDCEWRTLGEISEITGDPQASVSARLRDLRKPEFGGFCVEKRRRGISSHGLWEYRLLPTSETVAKTGKLSKKPSVWEEGAIWGMRYAARILMTNEEVRKTEQFISLISEIKKKMSGY